MIPPPIGISEMNATYAAIWYKPKKPACSVFAVPAPVAAATASGTPPEAATAASSVLDFSATEVSAKPSPRTTPPEAQRCHRAQHSNRHPAASRRPWAMPVTIRRSLSYKAPSRAKSPRCKSAPDRQRHPTSRCTWSNLRDRLAIPRLSATGN